MSVPQDKKENRTDIGKLKSDPNAAKKFLESDEFKKEPNEIQTIVRIKLGNFDPSCN